MSTKEGRNVTSAPEEHSAPPSCLMIVRLSTTVTTKTKPDTPMSTLLSIAKKVCTFFWLVQAVFSGNGRALYVPYVACPWASNIFCQPLPRPGRHLAYHCSSRSFVKVSWMSAQLYSEPSSVRPLLLSMTAYAKMSIPNQHSYDCFARGWLRAFLLRLQSK